MELVIITLERNTTKFALTANLRAKCTNSQNNGIGRFPKKVIFLNAVIFANEFPISELKWKNFFSDSKPGKVVLAT